MASLLNRWKNSFVEPSKEHYERVCEIYENEYDKICDFSFGWCCSLSLKCTTVLQILIFFTGVDILKYLIITQGISIIFTILFAQVNLILENRANGVTFSVKDWAQVTLVHPRLAQLYSLVLFTSLQPSNSVPLTLLLISYIVYDSYFLGMCGSQNVYLKTKYSSTVEDYLSSICLSLPADTYKPLSLQKKKRLWSSYLQNLTAILELILLIVLATTTLLGKNRIILFALYFQGLLTKSSIDPFLMTKFYKAAEKTKVLGF